MLFTSGVNMNETSQLETTHGLNIKKIKGINHLLKIQENQ